MGAVILKKLPWVSVLVAIACILVFWWAPYGSELFRGFTLRHSAPDNLIALISANFTHVDKAHLGWNLAALLVLGAAIEARDHWLFVVSLMAGVVVVDIWFYIQSQFTQYAGLSGALNTLLVVALYSLRAPESIFKGNILLWLVLALTVCKNLYELIFSVALFSDIRWQTTPSFHLVGLVAGCLVVVGCWYKSRAETQKGK